jgi:crescentin
MSKFGGLFGRRPSAIDQVAQPSPTAAEIPETTLELDEELFSALGSQIGGDNEALRNLLLDANAKIGELDTIKAAVGKLVDPVSKTLRALEAEKSEKISLQTILNNTRTAYGKLRNEVADLEKKLTNAEQDASALRQELAQTQNVLRTVEATKSEIAIDIAARRAQIADLEGRLAHESGVLRDENRRLDERGTTLGKRIVALEADLNAARQRLMMADDEKRTQQELLDRMSTDSSRMARKLSETEQALNAAQSRLRQVEGNFTELNGERGRLAAALDEAQERHSHELTSQRMRYEALQARTAVTDNLLVEARDHLQKRAEELRDLDRRFTDSISERDGLQARLAEMEAERLRRESEFKEAEQLRATLIERSGALTRAYTAKEAALGRAEDVIVALKSQIDTISRERSNDKQLAEQAIEELSAALQREKLDRAVVEGALETARKDFARVMREVMSLQRAQQAAEEPADIKAANAA